MDFDIVNSCFPFGDEMCGLVFAYAGLFGSGTRLQAGLSIVRAFV